MATSDLPQFPCTLRALAASDKWADDALAAALNSRAKQAGDPRWHVPLSRLAVHENVPRREPVPALIENLLIPRRMLAGAAPGARVFVVSTATTSHGKYHEIDVGCLPDPFAAPNALVRTTLKRAAAEAVDDDADAGESAPATPAARANALAPRLPAPLLPSAALFEVLRRDENAVVVGELLADMAHMLRALLGHDDAEARCVRPRFALAALLFAGARRRPWRGFLTKTLRTQQQRRGAADPHFASRVRASPALAAYAACVDAREVGDRAAREAETLMDALQDAKGWPAAPALVWYNLVPLLADYLEREHPDVMREMAKTPPE